MKKALTSLALISFLAVTMIPMVASAQAGPVKCIKLGADVKWTANVGEKKCVDGAYTHCLFKSGKAVGEEIKNGQCGATADITTTCETAAVWTNQTTYWEQNQSCLYNGWGMIGLLNGIGVATNWIFVILMVLVGLFVIWGAFDIVTDAGTPEKIGSGRLKITWALVGLAVALLSKALPGIVSALLGV